jgi:CheY-like chemotaxis protein
MGELIESSTQRRVLVVEDHEDSRDALVEALEGAGYQVCWVEDGQSAADLLKHDVPDLIVLDLMLPVLSGWELLRLLRADPTLTSIPIVVVSAYYTPHRELGAVRFVAKPASPEAVLRAIRDSVGPPPGDHEPVVVPNAATPRRPIL